MAGAGGDRITMVATPPMAITLAIAIGATAIGTTIITGDAQGRSEQLRSFLKALQQEANAANLCQNF